MSWSYLMKQHSVTNNKTDVNKSEVVSDENEFKVLRYTSDLRRKADREFYPRSYARVYDRIGEY